MDKDRRTNRWREAVADEIEKQGRLKAERSRHEGDPRPGAVFTLPAATHIVVYWAFVQTHPDDERILFAVLADDHPMVGITDVAVPDDACCSPLTLRCGQGIWAASHLFKHGRLTGVIDESTLLAVRRKLAGLVRGRIPATPAEQENDANPDYRDWMSRVAKARGDVEDWIEQMSSVIRLENFRPGRPGPRVAVPLAAASGGVLGEVSSILTRSIGAFQSFGPVRDCGGRGELHVMQCLAGVRLVWLDKEGEPPRVFATDNRGEYQRAVWVPAAEGTARETSPLFGWVGDGLSLRIEAESTRLFEVRRSEKEDCAGAAPGEVDALLSRLAIDGPRLATNPAWCLDQLASELPEPVTRELARSLGRYDAALDKPAREINRGAFESGVVGLLVDRESRSGFVSAFRAELASKWSVAPNLPFSAEVLAAALSRLIEASSFGLADLNTEFFAFRVDDALGEKTSGTSMTIAALLAILDAATDRGCRLLRRACAVVEHDDHENLRPATAIRVKLEAFLREFGRGTLLVRTSDCADSSAFDHAFETVWKVDTWNDLAAEVERAGLFELFRRRTPLDRHKLEIARERIREIADDQHRHREALELLRGLLRHPITPDVPLSAVNELRRSISDLFRHLGHYQLARITAWEEYRGLTEFASYDEQVRVIVAYTAALFDAHQFKDLVDLLEPWRERIEHDPSLVSADTRVMIFNTLARALIVRNQSGWEELFHRSIAIQEHGDIASLPRTHNYLIQGLLRNDRLVEASRKIDSVALMQPGNPFSRWFLDFARADLARRRGEIWVSAEMESRPLASGPGGHPFAYYFQATARQAGRSRDDAVARFEKARRFFLIDGVAEDDTANIQAFLASCVGLAKAAVSEDGDEWQMACARFASFFEPLETANDGLPSNIGLSNYYHAESRKYLFGCLPSMEVAEVLLRRVPYF